MLKYILTWIICKFDPLIYYTDQTNYMPIRYVVHIFICDREKAQIWWMNINYSIWGANLEIEYFSFSDFALNFYSDYCTSYLQFRF